MGELDGRIAIITGAGRGIGFAIAQRLCKAGAKVIIAEFDLDMGRKAVEKIKVHPLDTFAHYMKKKSEKNYNGHPGS